MGVAMDKKAGQGDIHLPASLEVLRILGSAGVSFHQHAGQAKLGAVAMGQTRVAVRPVGERLHMVALCSQAADRLLLQIKLGLAQRRAACAADF